MLLPDQSSQKSPKKDNSTLFNQQQPYQTPPPYVHVASTQLIPPQPWQQPQHVRRSAGRRFCKAFILAVLVCAVSSMFLGAAINLARSFVWGNWPYPDGSFPPDVDMDSCNSWETPSAHHSHDSYPYAASTSFDLPIDAAALFITSAGRSAGGSLKLQTSPDIDDVHVDVEIHYYREYARDKAKACLLKRGHNEHGVGVMVDQDWWPRYKEDKVFFVITATLPESATVHSFETNLANFVQNVDDITTLVTFENIELKSSNAPINVLGVTAHQGTFQSSNGPIQGEFYTDDHLNLHTSNSAIKASVYLTNDVKLNRDTTVDIKSSNGKISVSSSLLTKDNVEGGNFVVSSTSSNGPIELYFPDAPVKSTLRASARSSNSPVTVATHPTYQGSFDLSSSNLFPYVQRRGDGRNDPAGRGRTRTVRSNTIGRQRQIYGSTYWSEEESTGSVTIHSSNSPVGLLIG